VAWLYRIATHLCYDRFRKWERQPRSAWLENISPADAEPATSDLGEPSLGRVIEQAEMTGCVRGYLDDLSDDYRTVIILHDLEALTNTEIAELLGTTLDTVKIRLHRARRKLEAALAAHCDFSRDDQGVFVCEPAAHPTAPARRPVSKEH
jgi:RNA polymerase sigma-70 factor (ECF subfamily)